MAHIGVKPKGVPSSFLMYSLFGARGGDESVTAKPICDDAVTPVFNPFSFPFRAYIWSEFGGGSVDLLLLRRQVQSCSFGLGVGDVGNSVPDLFLDRFVIQPLHEHV